MLARLSIALPYNLAVPEGADFKVYNYEEDGYKITLLPPARTDIPISGDAPGHLTLNNKSAVVCNGLVIEFQKECFDRSDTTPIDPPEALIQRAVDTLITSLRYATGTHRIRTIRWPHVIWRLQYLRDDGSELDEAEGLVRVYGARKSEWSFVGVTPEVWDNSFSLGPDFKPPPWHDLLLDATAALPHVGTAVVLGATCLEVFIATVLDGLASRSSVPADVWHWMNNRKYRDNNPSVEEQFDSLLKILAQHSLKEDATLWEAFMNLKRARNTFVHEGVAQVGNVAVTLEQATRLVTAVGSIIAWVRQWLPDDMKWPVFSTKTTAQMAFLIPLGAPATSHDVGTVADAVATDAAAKPSEESGPVSNGGPEPASV